jgi:hypothetical protein
MRTRMRSKLASIVMLTTLSAFAQSNQGTITGTINQYAFYGQDDITAGNSSG